MHFFMELIGAIFFLILLEKGRSCHLPLIIFLFSSSTRAPLLITELPSSLPSSVRALRLLPFPGFACGNGLPLYRPDRRIATELLSGRTPSYSVAAAAQHRRCERREDHGGFELGDTPSLMLGAAARHPGAICLSLLPPFDSSRRSCLI